MMSGGMSPSLMSVGSLIAQMQLSQAVQQLQTSQALLQRELTSLIETTAQQSDADLRAGLKSDRAESRFAAAFVIGEKGLPFADDLIASLNDRNPLVRQAARRSLVLLSYHIDAAKKANRKGAKPKAVDFGPGPAASPRDWTTSAKKWKAWMDQNKSHLEARLDAAGPAK
jgi:hypothetical protein